MLKKILIANRGEIACRIIRTARRLGIQTVAVYSAADAQALHVQRADEVVYIGPAQAASSYLLMDKVIEAAQNKGADSIHPGYGFLSENRKFAEAVKQAGLIFIGPHSQAIELMGDKIISKKYAAQANVSTIPGYQDAISEEEQALSVAKEIGFPVMIKAAAGGGGKGMRIARTEQDLLEGFGAAGREAKASFGDDRVFIEKFIENPRHIEIQILCDKHGNGIHLGERECSIQRRNQKVIEEAPSSFLNESVRQKMGAEALALAQAVGYDSAGTVEFVMAPDRNFYFLEMNTRLQVEHPVTEMITKLDLVEEMIRIAAGEVLRYSQSDIKIDGWAMEARLYSEDPKNNFMPSTGRLAWFRPPEPEQVGAFRLDSGVEEGDSISMFYDPMIAKLITYAPTRKEAAIKMSMVLDSFRIEGITHNANFLNAIVNHKDFLSGDIDTGFIDKVWPEGFQEMPLDERKQKICLGIALFIYEKAKERAFQLEGRQSIPTIFEPTPLIVRMEDGHSMELFEAQSDWDKSDLDSPQRLKITLDKEKFEVKSSSWGLGDRLWVGQVADQEVAVQLSHSASGIYLFYQGSKAHVHVRSKAAENIAALLPEHSTQEDQTELICPMPGQVTSIHVKEGDEVAIGQALVTIEAMKMENILHAKNKAVIKKIHCKEGQSVGFEDLLMEFEISQEN